MDRSAEPPQAKTWPFDFATTSCHTRRPSEEVQGPHDQTLGHHMTNTTPKQCPVRVWHLQLSECGNEPLGPYVPNNASSNLAWLSSMTGNTLTKWLCGAINSASFFSQLNSATSRQDQKHPLRPCGSNIVVTMRATWFGPWNLPLNVTLPRQPCMICSRAFTVKVLVAKHRWLAAAPRKLTKLGCLEGLELQAVSGFSKS